MCHAPLTEVLPRRIAGRETPPTRVLTITLPEDLFLNLGEVAREKDVFVSEIVRGFIRQGMQKVAK